MFNAFPTRTTITAYEDEQAYIFKFGSYGKSTGAFTFTDITISSGVYTYSDTYKNFECLSMYKILQAAVIFKNTFFTKSDQLNFEYIDGIALSIDTSWEMFFGLLCFENINAHNSACLVFDTVSSTIENANITDSYFEYLRFERFTGNCIQFNRNCLVSGLKFGTINIEPSRLQAYNITYGTVTNEINLERYISCFNCIGDCDFTVDDIQMNNILYRYYVNDNKNYSFGSVINSSYNNIIITATINSISVGTCNRGINIINNIGFPGAVKSTVLINEINNRSNFTANFNVNQFGFIRVNSSPNKFSENDEVESSFKLCYKNYKRDNLQGRGLLRYDNTASNPKKLVITTNSIMTGTGKNFMQYIIGSHFNYLRILAKIPKDQNLEVRIQSNDGLFYEIGSATLLGTGEYKVYNINYTNTNYLGKVVNLGIVNNNENFIGSFESFEG